MKHDLNSIFIHLLSVQADSTGGGDNQQPKIDKTARAIFTTQK
jgi:hypothetical protein